MPSSSYTIVARPISIADIYVCLPILRQAKPDHSEAGMSQHTIWKHMSFKKSIFDNHFTVYIYISSIEHYLPTDG